MTMRGGGGDTSKEGREHQMRCRFIRTDNRLRFAKGEAVTWNVWMLNSLKWIDRLKVLISSYGRQPHTECAG